MDMFKVRLVDVLCLKWKIDFSFGFAINHILVFRLLLKNFCRYFCRIEHVSEQILVYLGGWCVCVYVCCVNCETVKFAKFVSLLDTLFPLFN